MTDPSPPGQNFTVVFDSGWIASRDARPLYGWHPANRVVVYSRELTEEEKVKEDRRICTYVGQNPGERRPFSSWPDFPPFLQRRMMQDDAGPKKTLLYYAYCDSGD